MKKLAGCLALLLCLLFITGCLPANDAEPLLAPAAEVRQIAVPVRTPEETQTPTDTEPPATTAPLRLDGVEMELSTGLTATPEEPIVDLCVRFPVVGLPEEADCLPCAMTVELDGEPVYERSDLALCAGAEEVVPLAFSFVRYQADRSAKVTVRLQTDTDVLERRTIVRLQNDPDEVYAARTGDAYPYSIEVLRNYNVVVIYGRDEAGDYTVPVKVWLCSTGYATPRGSYRLGSKREWGYLFGGVYGQYVCGITGNILFHSVPYTRMDKSSLKTDEYNKLGTAASMGCVRLAAGDARWLYDNCPRGTSVRIYDAEELPVKAPVLQPIDTEDPRSGWDPTDPDENNPWREEAPATEAAEEREEAVP